jgi:hypothetical protein
MIARMISRGISLSERSIPVLRQSALVLLALLVLVSGLRAGDKEVNAKIVKVDLKNNVITVSTEDGKKDFDVNDNTKFIGPKGGVSDKGIKDDRVVAGTEVRLVIAGNNRTLREVHLPERKSK